MGFNIADNVYLSVGGSVLSGYVTDVELSINGEVQDVTTMTNTWKAMLPGMKSWRITANFNQDFANSALDDILFAAFNTSVAIILKPDGGTTGSDNPKYTGNAILSTYGALKGSIGQALKSDIVLEGTGALSRAESD